MVTSENIHLTMQRHIGPESTKFVHVCDIEKIALLPEVQTTRTATEVEKLPLHEALTYLLQGAVSFLRS